MIKRQQKAFIFDMDGVILNSHPTYIKIFLLTLLKYRLIPTFSEVKSATGRRTIDVIRGVLRDHHTNKYSAEEIDEFIYDKVIESYRTKVRMFKGFHELAGLLRKKGYKMALVTSAEEKLLKVVFKRFAIKKYFDVIIDGSDVKHGKPDPEPYSLAIKKLGVKAGNCFVVEDSVSGTVSGKRAGAKVISVLTTTSRRKLEKANADFIFRSLVDIRDFIAEELH